MNSKKAILFHSDKLAIEAYKSTISANVNIEIAHSYTSIDSICTQIDTHDVDLLFVGHMKYDRSSFTCIRNSIILNSPSTKVVLLEYEWFHECDQYLIRPVRGVIDLTRQSKAEIRVSLNTIIRQGWDGNSNGSPAPIGVYLWKMDMISEDFSGKRSFEGRVMLVR